MLCETNRILVKDLWEYARQTSERTHHSLNQKHPIQYIKVQQSLIKKFYKDPNRYMKLQKNRTNTQTEMAFSNLGRVDNLVPANQSQVKVSQRGTFLERVYNSRKR